MWTSSSRAPMSHRSSIWRRDSMKQWLETREVLDFLSAARTAGKRVALATVVRVRGSAYRHEGAKLAVAGDGSSAGNVSGGCLEQDVGEGGAPGPRQGRAPLRSVCSRPPANAGVGPGVGWGRVGGGEVDPADGGASGAEVL